MSEEGKHINGGGSDSSGDQNHKAIAHHGVGKGGSTVVIARDEEAHTTGYEIVSDRPSRELSLVAHTTAAAIAVL